MEVDCSEKEADCIAKERSYDSLLEEGLIELVIHRCSEEEMGSGRVSVETYKYLLAAYLIKGDYDQARLLWLRLPAEVRKNTEMQSLWTIGKAMIKSDYPTVYASNSTFDSHIISKYRERTLTKVSLVYASISVDELSRMLGYNEESLPEKISHLGWSIDEGGFVMPVKPQVDPGAKDLNLKLSELANYVSFLENI